MDSPAPSPHRWSFDKVCFQRVDDRAASMSRNTNILQIAEMWSRHVRQGNRCLPGGIVGNGHDQTDISAPFQTRHRRRSSHPLVFFELAVDNIPGCRDYECRDMESRLNQLGAVGVILSQRMQIFSQWNRGLNSLWARTWEQNSVSGSYQSELIHPRAEAADISELFQHNGLPRCDPRCSDIQPDVLVTHW